jgi:2-polyprenyl-3-methyl-5-hydroxy-6-metoxy-1,4-benzoquinol methylase
VPAFGSGETRWIEGLGSLRNVIRQEVIARQLAQETVPGMSVLDVGCGQGTQAIRLAQRGCHVTGVDPSAALRQRCAERATAESAEIELKDGRIENLGEVVGGRQFDLVCCHGVLMYLGDDRLAGLASLATCVADHGKLSVTFRNGHALAMRPGLRRDWRAALAAFDSAQYVNELGLPATADRLDGIAGHLAAVGLRLRTWYGVRVLNDAIASDVTPPEPDELALLLDAEERAGNTDPYRWMASQLHVIAERAVPRP